MKEGQTRDTDTHDFYDGTVNFDLPALTTTTYGTVWRFCVLFHPVKGTREGRILAGYYGFNANISFLFQKKNLSAHLTYLRFGLFCKF